MNLIIFIPHTYLFGQCIMLFNNEWRVCFVWQHGNAYDVEICDYH